MWKVWNTSSGETPSEWPGATLTAIVGVTKICLRSTPALPCAPNEANGLRL